MNVAQTDRDENGDTQDEWLVRRSHALLAPVCRMGCMVLAPLLLLADPLFSLWHLWPTAVDHNFLLAFHATTFVFLAAMYALARPGTPRQASHAQRQRRLVVFIAGCLGLSVWFGVVSWLAFGDLSMVAVTVLMIAAVFPYPGTLRRWGYLAQAVTMAAGILAFDASGKFLGQLQFVNVLALLAVAFAIDAYVMRNARALFAQKCELVRERQRADTVLFNALPVAIAEELKAHGEVAPRSHPHMTILFADIVGFTALASRLPVADVPRLLNQLYHLLDAEVDRCRVEKIKTMGDAYMVVHPDDAAAVARFALSMQGCVERVNIEWNLHLSMRIGMHRGAAVAGVIGTLRPLYDVWGDAVNLASRMESCGVPGHIHVTDAVRGALEPHFALQRRGQLQVSGFGQMVTHFLLGVRQMPQTPAC